MTTTNSRLLVLLFSLLPACASRPEPHDASVVAHDAAAHAHDQEAVAHASQYDPSALDTQTRCGRGDPSDGAVCWTSRVNPTKEHLAMAEEHRRAAAAHRAASQALRDAEARACAGLDAGDRDESPFWHREDIASVEPLVVETHAGKTSTPRTVGAIVTVRAVKGMTAQWLQRLVDCHLARNAALGHDVPEMAYCPLVPRGASAHVAATDTGFAISVSVDDAATAEEVLRRARALQH